MPWNFTELLGWRQIPHFLWHQKIVSNADKKESSQILFGKRLVINKFPWIKSTLFEQRWSGLLVLFWISRMIHFHAYFAPDRCCLFKCRLELYWLKKADPLTFLCNWMESNGMAWTNPKDSSLFWGTRRHIAFCTYRTRGENIHKNILFFNPLSNPFWLAVKKLTGYK